jgi:hypothetical protein
MGNIFKDKAKEEEVSVINLKILVVFIKERRDFKVNLKE